MIIYEFGYALRFFDLASQSIASLYKDLKKVEDYEIINHNFLTIFVNISIAVSQGSACHRDQIFPQSYEISIPVRYGRAARTDYIICKWT